VSSVGVKQGVKQGFPGHGLQRWDPELELRELPGFVVGRKVTVPSRRHRHVGVSERPLDDDRVDTGPEVERGGRVTQVVASTRASLKRRLPPTRFSASSCHCMLLQDLSAP